MIHVDHVNDLDEMGPGALVGTPIPCARVMMTLASRGKLPQTTTTTTTNNNNNNHNNNNNNDNNNNNTNLDI